MSKVKEIFSVLSAFVCTGSMCFGVMQTGMINACPVYEHMYDNYLYYEKVDEDNDGTDDYIKLIDCDKSVTEVEIPSEIDGLPVKEIFNTFYCCKNIESITIPDSVTTIDAAAFGDCANLETIIIPESVVEISGFAFEYTPWIDAKRKENPLVIVNNILVDGKTSSGNVVIPDNVTEISDNAF